VKLGLTITVEGYKVYLTGEDLSFVKSILKAKHVVIKRLFGQDRWKEVFDFKTRTKKWIIKDYESKTELINLYDEIDENIIYIGFGILKKVFQEIKNHYSVTANIPSDPIVKLKFDRNILPNITLRDYQLEALEAMSYNRGGLIKLPTGSGKGFILLSFGKVYSEVTGKKVLILSPTITSEDENFSKSVITNLNVVKYRDVRTKNHIESSIIFGTPLMLNGDIENGSVPSFIRDVEVIISDEVQHSKSDSWTELILSLPNIKRSYGVSATPVECEYDILFHKMDIDSARTYSVTGPILYEKKAADHAISKFLNKPHLVNLEFKGTAIYDGNNWHKILTFLRKEDRIEFLSEVMKLLDKYNINFIIFVTLKATGNALYDKAPEKTAKWYGSGYIELGKERITTKGSPNTMIKDLISKGDIKHLVVTQHADESLDISSLDAVIVHESRKKLKSLQRSGRGLRLSERKKSYIINITDTEIGVLKYHAKVRASNYCDEYGIISEKVNSIEELENLLKGR
jgi:superfamily II DNA or RNA helicase